MPSYIGFTDFLQSKDLEFAKGTRKAVQYQQDSEKYHK